MLHRWDAPDGGRSVIFHDAVIEKLRGRVIEAFLSLPRRGAEVGGLLFGRIDSADPLVVRVESFEEIPCEHRFGPSFVLDEADLAKFVDSLGHERPEGFPPVVGFFRSFTGREAALEETDANLIRTYFPQELSLFLLLKPLAADSCEASFVFWNQGSPEPQSTYAAEPFDPESFTAQEPAPEPVSSPQPAGAAASAKLVRPPINLPPPRRRRIEDTDERPVRAVRKGRGILLPLAACILLSVAAAFVFELWTLARQPHWSPLKLDARQTATGIDLSWDRTAGAVAHANRGVLSVEDGGAKRDIELTPAQIRGGQYVYPAAHADVLFRLALYGKGLEAAGDSLRLVGSRQSAPVTASNVAAPPPQPSKPEQAADRVTPETAGRPPEPAGAPVAIREVQPQVPAGIRSRIQERIVIPVDVRVSPGGRVIAAVPQRSGDTLHHYLADQAAAAARSWRFLPARSRNGRRVTGQKTIYFVFNPAG